MPIHELTWLSFVRALPVPSDTVPNRLRVIVWAQCGVPRALSFSSCTSTILVETGHGISSSLFLSVRRLREFRLFDPCPQTSHSILFTHPCHKSVCPPVRLFACPSDRGCRRHGQLVLGCTSSTNQILPAPLSQASRAALALI